MAQTPKKERAPFVVPGWVRDAGLDLAQFRILSQIKSRCGENGHCFESMTSMAAVAMIRKSTCFKVVADLEAMGLIKVTRRAGATGQVSMAAGWEEVLESRSEARRCISATGIPNEPVQMGPEPVSQTHPTGPIGNHEGGFKEVLKDSPQEAINNYKPRKPPSAAQTGADKPDRIARNLSSPNRRGKNRLPSGVTRSMNRKRDEIDVGGLAVVDTPEPREPSQGSMALVALESGGAVTHEQLVRAQAEWRRKHPNEEWPEHLKRAAAGG